MKKLLAILLSLAFVFSACAGDPEQPAPGTKTYRFFVPDGAPALAVANFTAPSAQLTDFSLHVVNAPRMLRRMPISRSCPSMPLPSCSETAKR